MTLQQQLEGAAAHQGFLKHLISTAMERNGESREEAERRVEAAFVKMSAEIRHDTPAATERVVAILRREVSSISL